MDCSISSFSINPFMLNCPQHFLYSLQIARKCFKELGSLIQSIYPTLWLENLHLSCHYYFENSKLLTSSASFWANLFMYSQRIQAARETVGESFVNITVKDPISFQPLVNPAKLHELGLAPSITSKTSSSKNSKKAPTASQSKPYCEQYAVSSFGNLYV